MATGRSLSLLFDYPLEELRLLDPFDAIVLKLALEYVRFVVRQSRFSIRIDSSFSNVDLLQCEFDESVYTLFTNFI